MTAQQSPAPNAVIFDLGGVVLQWDPRRAFAQVLPEHEIDPLMQRIDFPRWNHQQDLGRSFEDAEAELRQRFPDDAEAVAGYREHFGHTLTGMVPGTSAVIAELDRAGVRLAALTNWSAETFPLARKRFGILNRFAGIVVSGTEGLGKPDPEIFELTVRRHDLDASRTVFVDDSPANVEAAERAGLIAVHFTDSGTLRARLQQLGLLESPNPLSQKVFHIAEAGHWNAALAGDGYPWSARGVGYEAEGFVHASFAHQLPGVLDRYWADADWSDLVLLELDTDRAPIVLEAPGPDAEPYPHLYAELTPELVAHSHQGVQG